MENSKALITDLISKYFFPEEDTYVLKRLTEKTFAKLAPNPHVYLKEKQLETLKNNYANRGLGMALSFWIANGCLLLTKEQIHSYIWEAVSTPSAKKYCIDLRKGCYAEYLEEEMQDFSRAYLDFFFYAELLQNANSRLKNTFDFEDYFSNEVVNRVSVIEALGHILNAPNGKKNFAIALICLKEEGLLQWTELKPFFEAVYRRFGEKVGTRANMSIHVKNYYLTAQKASVKEKNDIKNQLMIR